MKNNRLLISVFILLIMGTQLGAQYFPHRQFTINDGLPSNNVYGMLEDDNGFLWIYTEKGVSKFDGYEFKNYSIEDGLPANDIFLMRKNHDGRIWMQGPEGSVGYIENDSIVKKDLGVKTNLAFQKVNNELYFWTNNQLWSVKNNKVQKEKSKLHDLNKRQSTIQWLFVNSNKYYGLDLEHQKILELDSLQVLRQTKIKFKYDPKNYIRRSQIIQARHPYILSLTTNGILQIEIATGETAFYPWFDFFDNPTNLFVTNNEENLLRISTNNGIIHITDFKELNSVNFSSLANKYALQRSYQDSEGNIWTGTKENGLLFFSKDQLKANLIETENSDDNTYKFIKKLLSGDLIAISSRGSVYNMTLEKKIIESDYENTFVTHVIQTAQDELLIAKNAGPGKFLSFNKDNKSYIDKKLKNFNVLNFHTGPVNLLTQSKTTVQRSNSDFYTSTTQGLFRVFLNKQNLPESHRLGHKQRILFNNTYSNEIYSADKEKLYKIKEEKKLETILSLPLISSISSINENELLIGTESSGLYKYTIDENLLTKIGNYGTINQIRIEDPSTFYIGTNEGIKKIATTKDTNYVEKYWGLNQGLPSLEVFDFIIEGDHLYAGTSNGISKIELNTSEQTIRTNSHKLSIKGISVNGKNVEPDRNFYHSQNDIILNYSLLDKKSFGQISYRYKLLPIQKEWQSTTDRSVIFNNLAPNDYIFKLEAFDSNNISYQLEEDFQFTIKNPFWNTAVFYLAMIATMLLALLLLDRRRKNKMDKEIERAKSYNRRMANLKLEALRSQMNPHFVFNSLGAIQYYIQTHKIEEADNYLTLFANLMRKYLNSSSEQMINLSDEISLLKDYVNLEKIRFEGMFEMKFLIDNAIDLKHVLIPPMMIQPFVENAINHGLLHRKDRKALLSISIIENSLKEIIIEIIDNGIGRENAKKFKKRFHKSKGMLNVSNRVESLKAAELVNIKINITNNSNDDLFPGTKVVINLKKQKQWNTQPLS